jgi:hypothetical protein
LETILKSKKEKIMKKIIQITLVIVLVVTFALAAFQVAAGGSGGGMAWIDTPDVGWNSRVMAGCFSCTNPIGTIHPDVGWNS